MMLPSLYKSTLPYPLIADIGVELLQKAAWNHVVWELNNPPVNKS